MSNFVTGFVGAASLAASLGAAQYAVGHDLSGTTVQIAAMAQGNLVNRSAKADRQAGINPAVSSATVIRLSALNDMSVVTRVPRQQQLQIDGNAGRKISRRPIACEAPASVLTDIAKQMESGRCVT